MKHLISLLLALATSYSAEAALWYVDSGAAGANSGTSWANAWTSFPAINWSVVNPGDTVYISGGATASQKVYGGQMTITKDGSAGNPITITVKADDPAHNGTVVLSGNYIEMSTRKYITISGNVGGAQKFHMRDFFNTTTAEFANMIMAPNSQNCVFEYLNISNVNNNININQSANFTIRNTVQLQTRGDAAVRANGTFSAGYDGNLIENNIIEVASSTVPGPTQGMGPDGIQTGNNITFRGNTFRVKQYPIVTSLQHTDMIQAPGAFLAIYNNDFQNVGDNCIQLHGWYAGSAHSNVRIYNNVFRIIDPIDPFPQYMRLYNVGWPITDISNLIVANNLFLDNSWVNIETDVNSVGGHPTGSGNLFMNNIFFNGSGGTGTRFWNWDTSSSWAAGALQINGNCYYQGGNVVVYNGVTYTCTSWVAGNELAGNIGAPLWASYTYRTLGNNLHLSGSDTVARNTGLNLSTIFTTDKDGVTRVVPWDKGPYEYPSSGSATPVIDVAVTGVSVSEGAGTAVITVRRSGTIAGAIGCSWATANGTATTPANYTGNSGTLSWADADGSDKTITVTLVNTSMLEPKTFTVTISTPTGGAILGSQTVTTVTLLPTGTPASPILTGWGPWPANTGEIAFPFTVSGSEVSQTLDNNNPLDGGRASYTFTNSPGQYRVIVEVNAPTTGANSIFADMNQEPTTPLAICDFVLLTLGFEDRLISWRGNTGTPDTQEFSPKVWTLAGGTNTLIIRGREPGNPFRQVTLDPVIPEPPPGDPVAPTVVSVASTTAHGYYKTNIVIPITVTWSTNATVTGSPRILMNTGGYATYASGSGGTNHLYNYPISAGENTQVLDYDNPAALELNGGTIKNLTTDADLTMPIPGGSGSLSQSVVLIVDTMKPTISVAAPVIAETISYQVTYTDTNFLGVTLNTTNVALVASGTLAGTPTVIGGSTGQATIQVAGTTGIGTLHVDIATGTCVDQAGNLADAASTGSVDVTHPTVTGVTSTQPAGFYKESVVIPVTIAFSHAVTVTGSPRLLMNTGGFANYFSGSGTANLLFNYTIVPGENTQLLNYATTAALQLNGGTINFSFWAADRTLPATGSPSSLAGDVTLVVDTIKPTISIASPLVGTDVSFAVTYADVNYLSTSLDTSDLTLQTTGGVSGVATATNVAANHGTIVISSITGNGRMVVNVAAGTAVDRAGNLADASATVGIDVSSSSMQVIRHGKFSNAIFGNSP